MFFMTLFSELITVTTLISYLLLLKYLIISSVPAHADHLPETHILAHRKQKRIDGQTIRK